MVVDSALAPRDFTVSFFNNHRVPAVLLAATAIKDAFILQGRKDVALKEARAWRLIRYAY
jgi:hypothetical protein